MLELELYRAKVRAGAGECSYVVLLFFPLVLQNVMNIFASVVSYEYLIRWPTVSNQVDLVYPNALPSLVGDRVRCFECCVVGCFECWAGL